MLATSSRTRLIAVVVAGVAAGAVAAAFSAWQLAVLVGWGVAATTFVAWVWTSVARFTPDQTREFSTREDDGRVATTILLLSASVVSLVGVALALFKASKANTSDQAALTVAAVVTVALSWVVVHTVFTLRYARQYYSEPRRRHRLQGRRRGSRLSGLRVLRLHHRNDLSGVRHRRAGSEDPAHRPQTLAAVVPLRRGDPGGRHQRHRGHRQVARRATRVAEAFSSSDREPTAAPLRRTSLIIEIGGVACRSAIFRSRR